MEVSKSPNQILANLENSSSIAEILSTIKEKKLNLNELCLHLGLPLPTDDEGKIKDISASSNKSQLQSQINLEQAQNLLAQGILNSLMNNKALFAELKQLSEEINPQISTQESSQLPIGNGGGDLIPSLPKFSNVVNFVKDTKNNLTMITVATAGLLASYPYSDYIDSIEGYFKGPLEGLKPYLLNMGGYAGCGFLYCTLEINKLVNHLKAIKESAGKGTITKEACQGFFDIIEKILIFIGPYVLPKNIYDEFVEKAESGIKSDPTTTTTEENLKQFQANCPTYYAANISAVIAATEILKVLCLPLKSARVEPVGNMGGGMKKKRSKRKSNRSTRRSRRRSSK